MERAVVENSLNVTTEELRVIRDEIQDLEWQLARARGIVDDMRLRSALAETPIAAQQLIVARQHMETITNEQVSLMVSLRQASASQARFLDEMYALAKFEDSHELDQFVHETDDTDEDDVVEKRNDCQHE